ncbi:hypothetical protein EVAR_81648_1 [Eumeta japonica]|uniref:Uncharacterized protein n=1 Tax=Eumeta variegata TaxID=151549 RepID=A0A4C1V2U6_EUMVA|nr:hypothetical protein EVAR_81648_1 [Eumeta japonica]
MLNDGALNISEPNLIMRPPCVYSGETTGESGWVVGGWLSLYEPSVNGAIQSNIISDPTKIVAERLINVSSPTILSDALMWTAPLKYICQYASNTFAVPVKSLPWFTNMTIRFTLVNPLLYTMLKS